MPFIKTATTEKIDEKMQRELTRELGQAITLIPGKSEHWLMLKLEGGADMAFRGSTLPCAMVEADLYGSADAAALDALTARVTEILSSHLGIDPERIYVRYLSTPDWGYAGSNF